MRRIDFVGMGEAVESQVIMNEKRELFFGAMYFVIDLVFLFFRPHLLFIRKTLEHNLYVFGHYTRGGA